MSIVRQRITQPHLQVCCLNHFRVILDAVQVFCLFVVGCSITAARKGGTKVYIMWVPCTFDRCFSTIFTDTDDTAVRIISKWTHCRCFETNRRREKKRRGIRTSGSILLHNIKACASLYKQCHKQFSHRTVTRKSDSRCNCKSETVHHDLANCQQGAGRQTLNERAVCCAKLREWAQIHGFIGTNARMVLYQTTSLCNSRVEPSYRNRHRGFWLCKQSSPCCLRNS